MQFIVRVLGDTTDYMTIHADDWNFSQRGHLQFYTSGGIHHLVNDRHWISMRIENPQDSPRTAKMTAEARPSRTEWGHPQPEDNWWVGI